MDNLLEILIGGLTLGLPLWFAFLDRRAAPRLLWMEEGGSTPFWGKMVVVVGVCLAILIALSAPMTGFEAAH